MPVYEFECEKCQNTFTLVMSVKEYEKKDFRCPKCKTIKVRQVVTPFQTITSKKS